MKTRVIKKEAYFAPYWYFPQYCVKIFWIKIWREMWVNGPMAQFDGSKRVFFEKKKSAEKFAKKWDKLSMVSLYKLYQSLKEKE